MEKVTIGNAELYCGDCAVILPQLEPVDLILTDPPYGLGDLWQGGKKKWPLHHQDGMDWDSVVFDGLLETLEPAGKTLIVWGGHLYKLPTARGWLVWDKLVRNFTSGHCEFAWTTIDQPIKAYNYSHGQLATEGKQHPTQKPVPLMEWCITQAPEDTQTVCDPFMGSGTTGVAAMNLEKRFIGIERERKYFDIACERISQAQAQGRLAI